MYEYSRTIKNENDFFTNMYEHLRKKTRKTTNERATDRPTESNSFWQTKPSPVRKKVGKQRHSRRKTMCYEHLRKFTNEDERLNQRARRGEARRGEARRGEARRGEARRGEARWANERTSEETNERTSERANERASERVIKLTEATNKTIFLRTFMHIYERRRTFTNIYEYLRTFKHKNECLRTFTNIYERQGEKRRTNERASDRPTERNSFWANKNHFLA